MKPLTAVPHPPSDGGFTDMHVLVQPHAETGDAALPVALTDSALARLHEAAGDRPAGLQLLGNPLFGRPLQNGAVLSMYGKNWISGDVRGRPGRECDCLLIR